jgi:hypothetical protein
MSHWKGYFGRTGKEKVYGDKAAARKKNRFAE